MDYKDLTYRDLAIMLKKSTNKKEMEAIVSELQLRESEVLQIRRSATSSKYSK